MKRPLFVFAGQSNMMGAAVYEASEQIYYENSYEYLHKPRRFGATIGQFKTYGFPTGEFSYKDLKLAYGDFQNGEVKSSLNDYQQNCYFCPSMNNLNRPFADFSESTHNMASSLAPYIVKGLEEKGLACAYTHIAKGGVAIDHYLEGQAAYYFAEKVTDFFADCAVRFKEDDIDEKVLVWLQGESDSDSGYEYYMDALRRLWSSAKRVGFTKFFIIRVGYWGSENIVDVMRAQEDFSREMKDAFIITRVCSFMEFYGQDTNGWFCDGDSNDFTFCRDSFYGYDNQHINEKGFRLIAQYAVPNIIRILYEGGEPVLEQERIFGIKHKLAMQK